MSKDHPERRTYRKSPGRQYGYDYDPLRSQQGASQKSQSGIVASRTGTILAQRPDPRRTRQLMRQSIIASKRVSDEEHELTDSSEQEQYEWHDGPMSSHIGQPSSVRTSHHSSSTSESAYYDHKPVLSRRPARSGQTALYAPTPSTSDNPPRLPPTRALRVADDGYDDAWREPVASEVRSSEVFGEDEVDRPVAEYNEHVEDEAYDEPIYTYDDEPAARPSHSIRKRRPVLTRRLEPDPELDYDAPERMYPVEKADYDYEYEYEEDRTSVPRQKKKRSLSRRGLLWGAGIAAVAGVGVVAAETLPKLPQAVNDASSNVEKQVQDAFNRGLTQGATQARQDLINSLDTIEGFTLDGAIGAALLTRVAYDVFVSPVIRFGSALTGDFLTGMLNAFKTARSWLAGVYQDNATLAAIQSVLESWVKQVNQMPKQLDAITQSDLDGAQAYLRALQRKIKEEQDNLNKTPAKNATSTPTPTQK